MAPLGRVTVSGRDEAGGKQGPEGAWMLFYFILFYFILFYFTFKHHMKVPRLGIQLELQLPGLHHSHSHMGSELRL